MFSSPGCFKNTRKNIRILTKEKVSHEVKRDSDIPIGISPKTQLLYKNPAGSTPAQGID